MPQDNRLSRSRFSIVISALLGSGLVLLGLALFSVELTIRTTGQVYSRDEARLYAPFAGVIARHRAMLGQDVRAGEILLELDDTDLALRMVQLERELAEVDAALIQQDIALRKLAIRPAPPEMASAPQRKERLARIAAIQNEIEKSYADGRGQQVISDLELRRQEIERLRAELEFIQADLLAGWHESGLSDLERERIEAERQRLAAVRELLQTELALVRSQREACRIRAPIDGRIVALHARYAGMAVARGAELMKVAPTGGPLLVHATVPERNVDLLRVGAPARMESKVFDSMLEGAVVGTVVRIAPEALPLDGHADAGRASARYEVDIAVERTPYPLVLGSRVDIRLYLGRRSLAEILLRNARHARKEQS
jgi:multidrug resistance efflux pump